MGPRMRAAQRFAVVLLVLFFGTAGARAGFTESQDWFNALPMENRTEIQSDLILLGYYNFLVDGAFGQGTFASITAFQRSLSRAVTGILSDGDLTRLRTGAADVSSRLGLSNVDDSLGKIRLVLPAALLTRSTTNDSGTAYSSEDGGVVLTTVSKPVAETSFSDLYATLSRRGAAAHHLVRQLQRRALRRQRHRRGPPLLPHVPQCRHRRRSATR